MADVIYKRGPLSNLPEHAADGEILVATLADNTKEAEMYIGFVDAKRKITDTSKQDRIGAVETSEIPDLGLQTTLKLDSAAINEISFDNQIYISGPQGTYGVNAQNISEFAKTITIEGNNSIDIASQGDSIQLGHNNGLSLRSSNSEINVNNNRISNLVAPETDDQAANKAYVDRQDEWLNASLKSSFVLDWTTDQFSQTSGPWTTGVYTIRNVTEDMIVTFYDKNHTTDQSFMYSGEGALKAGDKIYIEAPHGDGLSISRIITVNDKQDKLTTYSELAQNDDTVAQLNAKSLELVGRSLGTQEVEYDITYEGGSGQELNTVYTCHSATSSEIHYDYISEGDYKGFAYNSNDSFTLSQGTKFKLLLDESYYTDVEERNDAIEKISAGWGISQHLKLVIYEDVWVVGGDMPIHNVAEVTSGDLSITSDSGIMNVYGTGYQYDIQLVGSASSGFTQATAISFEVDHTEEDKSYCVINTTEGGFNFYLLNTDKNNALPPIQTLIDGQINITLSAPADSQGNATLSFDGTQGQLTIRGVAEPTEAFDAVNKQYVDTNYIKNQETIVVYPNAKFSNNEFMVDCTQVNASGGHQANVKYLCRFNQDNSQLQGYGSYGLTMYPVNQEFGGYYIEHNNTDLVDLIKKTPQAYVSISTSGQQIEVPATLTIFGVNSPALIGGIDTPVANDHIANKAYVDNQTRDKQDKILNVVEDCLQIYDYQYNTEVTYNGLYMGGSGDMSGHVDTCNKNEDDGSWTILFKEGGGFGFQPESDFNGVETGQYLVIQRSSGPDYSVPCTITVTTPTTSKYRISNVAKPTEDNDVATKAYVDNMNIATYYDLQTEESLEAPRMPLSLGYGAETDPIVISAPNGISLSRASAGSLSVYDLDIGEGISMNPGAVVALSESSPLIAPDQLKLVGGFSTGDGNPWGNGNALYIDSGKACFLNQANSAPIKVTGIATPTEANDAVNKAYVDALDNVLKDIRDAIRGGGTTEQTVAQIEQLITNYLETKTVAEVEE